MTFGRPGADYLASSIPSRLDHTSGDTAVGSRLLEHLLLSDRHVEVRAHHELLARILTKFNISQLCNNFNSHNLN